MTKTLTVHGLDGSAAPHWQHWWAASDSSAIMVDLPNPSQPDPTLWETELAGMALRHPGSILVGHSLGAVLIARVLARFSQLNIRAALLVAPADPERAARISQFGALPALRFGIPITLAASRNDPWMPAAHARAWAGQIGAEFLDMGFAGHINVASGFGPWPQGKALRDDLIARSIPARRSAQPLNRAQGASL
jgi:uncharacterized protein